MCMGRYTKIKQCGCGEGGNAGFTASVLESNDEGLRFPWHEILRRPFAACRDRPSQTDGWVVSSMTACLSKE